MLAYLQEIAKLKRHGGDKREALQVRQRLMPKYLVLNRRVWKQLNNVSDANPPNWRVLVIMIAYVMVMATTITAGATQEIKGYKRNNWSQYQDENTRGKSYLVEQDSVKNVLKN